MAGGEQVAVEERIDGLYAGRPEDFVSRRDALATELRRAGHGEAAAAVKALRRPTAAAWAVNQLACRHGEALTALLDLGERLRAAQEELLAGGGPAGLREAAAERRRLVSELADLAVAGLGPGGGSHLEAVTRTLEAAVSDPDRADAVRRGRLARELEPPSGLGGLAAAPPAGARPAARATTGRRSTSADSGQGQQAGPAAEEQVPEQAEGSARLDRLRRDFEEKSARAREAAREAAAAGDEVRRLRRLLSTAEAAVEAATQRAQRAEAATQRAEAELRRAQPGRPG